MWYGFECDSVRADQFIERAFSPRSTFSSQSICAFLFQVCGENLGQGRSLTHRPTVQSQGRVRALVEGTYNPLDLVRYHQQRNLRDDVQALYSKTVRTLA